MAERKALADLDRLFRSKNSLFGRISIYAADRQRIMRIGILLVELDRPQRRVQTFPNVLLRLVTPAIRDDAGAHTGEPDVGLCEFRIEPACLPKQLPGFQVGLAANVMKMPGALAHQVPGSHIAGVTGGGRK